MKRSIQDRSTLESPVRISDSLDDQAAHMPSIGEELQVRRSRRQPAPKSAVVAPASGTATVTFRSGQEVFGTTSGHGMVYIVRAGCVRLYKKLPSNRSINLGIMGPNTVFTQEDGTNGIASGTVAEAMVDSTILIVPVDELESVIASSPELAAAMVTGMTRRLTEMQTLVEHLLVRDTAIRLAVTLHEPRPSLWPSQRRRHDRNHDSVDPPRTRKHDRLESGYRQPKAPRPSTRRSHAPARPQCHIR